MMLIPYEPFHDGYDALRRAVKREQIAYEGRNKLAEYRKARGQRRRELMTELLHLGSTWNASSRRSTRRSTKFNRPPNRLRPPKPPPELPLPS